MFTSTARPRRIGRWRPMAGVLCAAALALAGCGSDSDDAAESGSSSPASSIAGDDTPGSSATNPDGAGSGSDAQPVRGGTLVYAAINDQDNLSFHTMGTSITSGGYLRRAVYGNLYFIGSDSNIVYELAESFTPDDTGTVWTLVLRGGLTFSDGTPYDAEAVKWNWEKFAELPGGGQSLAASIASMEVIDARTLKVTLEEPNTVFNYMIDRYMMNIGSPTARQEMGDDAFFAAPVGAGPFVLTEWARGDRMVLTRNEHYFDPEKPYIDELVIRVLPDESQRLNTAQVGDVDLALFQLGQSIDAAEQAGLEATVFSPAGGQYIAFNNTSAPFDNPLARQALAAAIDADALVDVVNAGHGEVARALFPEGNPYHVDEPALATYDPAKAQELFDQYAEENGGPLSFQLTTNTSSAQLALGEAIQTQLSQYDNVEMSLNTVTQAVQIETVYGGAFQSTIWGANGQHPFPLINNFLGGDTFNVSNYASPEMDAAIERLGSLDPDESHAAIGEVQTLLAQDVPGVFLIRQIYSTVSAGNIGGLDAPNALTAGFTAFDSLWIED